MPKATDLAAPRITASQASETGPTFTLEQALEMHPPGKNCSLVELTYPVVNSTQIALPTIRLHCSSDACNGIHYFDCSPSRISISNAWDHFFLKYTCRHCKGAPKRFAIAIRYIDFFKSTGELFKFGELPAFGPPLPKKLQKIISNEEDWNLFMKGRRCEGQGLGIAAFAYYRRVVERRKNELFDEIHKVAKRLGASEDFLSSVVAAKGDNRFSASVELIKSGLPQRLLINGHNPLTLLHDALSDGIHNESDEECLLLASSIRVILCELCELTTDAFKEETEVKEAIATLVKRKEKKASKSL